MINSKIYKIELLKANKFKFNAKIKTSIRSFLFLLKSKNKKNKIIILIVLLISIINFYKLFKNIDIKICLCVIAKDENLYAREFVEHYKKIGYNNIYIYDNNDKYGEKFEEVINDYIKSGFVKIFDFRERNESSFPQFDAYKDCYHKYNKYYNWLSFYDMDEFLELNKKYNKIQDFLKDKIFEKCQNIKINFLQVINDHNLYYENKPLYKRLVSFRYNDSLNVHIKSTVKGSLPLNYWEKYWNPHSSTLNYTSCSSSGKIVDYDSPFINPPDYTNAKLIHYYFKSFEEYCRKIKRGFADRPKSVKNLLVKDKYNELYLQYKNDTEKLKIIHKVFNETIYKLFSNKSL